ncbi:isoleucine--tRNA ligase [Candidatus Kaiserbacteria bacterium]|nr:isoleucine--tRNA ligase [Candidatus Kaiserbacteria bacterium]
MSSNGEEAKKGKAAEREEQTLAFWDENRIFEKTLAKEAPKGDFVFYDGPPFATGLPHYGHLLQSAIKDAVPRYKTMCGYRVARQWGWDCHGLPIENIVEKELGTKSKKDILAMGVKAFNDLCRERIFTFIHEWERIIPRFGRWADMEHPYRTMDFSYMQSEWWAFKTLHEKGFVYEDYRSMHICPRCETTLSQGEVAEGYKDVKDLSATVKFKIRNPEQHGLPPNSYFLAWTTTPWTLPGNVALAVGADIKYATFQTSHSPESSIREPGSGSGEVLGGATYIAEQEKLAALFLNTRPHKPSKEMAGRELVGIEYEPLFDHYYNDEKLKNRENGWKVYAADFVTTDTGTGIVHIAPAFGADDMMLGKKENLPFVQHVKMDGTFVDEVFPEPVDLKPRAKNKPEEIREADLTIVRALGDKVFASEKYEHPYPHCWRCDTALLNYATSSWFVAVEKMKPTLLETAKSINWSPAHIKEGRFGQWLEGARDWSISRQRFWANTIPVWRCEKCKKDQVFGSTAELGAASGTKVGDLHKEFVDEITVPCECGGSAYRIPDVLDTWFDSGSVPFATKGYGAAQAAAGERLVPADFIGEAQDQCRAWFYYQHVLAGGLFENQAFKNCIVTGIVLAEDGKKMSKKLKNYPDPQMMIDVYGADAMRLYMLSSPVVRAESLSFSEKEVADLSRKIFGRLGNVYEFYALYQGTAHEPSATSTNVLDRWILARLAQVHAEVTNGLDRYALEEATRPFDRFVDDLSTWYLRRSRARVKGDDTADRIAALATMAYVLCETAKILAPFAPFFADWLWQEMRHDDDTESVHLARWSDAWELTREQHQLVADMTEARNVVSLALEQRSAAKIPVRQPLGGMTLTSGNPTLPPDLMQIIADEVNVKEIMRIAGEGTGWGVVLDTNMTPELREEGLARELVRVIQQARKDAGLAPGQKVSVEVSSSEPLLLEAAEKWRTGIMSTTSLSELRLVAGEQQLRVVLG